MTIRVGIQGSIRLARYLAAAVEADREMQLVGVVGWDRLSSVTTARGYPLMDSVAQLAAVCDVMVGCDATSISIVEADSSHRLVQCDKATHFTVLTSDACRALAEVVHVASADAVALARIVRAVSGLRPIRRLYSNVISRAAHAADPAQSSLDALEPVMCTDLTSQLRDILAGIIPVVQVRRVLVPCTHSHLHTLKLDISSPMELDALVTALKNDPRIHLGSVENGFHSTADIGEFCRDHGRSPNDRREVFVWEESIFVSAGSVCLMFEIAPDSLAIPEGLDAIRWIGRPELPLASIRQLTDVYSETSPSILSRCS